MRDHMHMDITEALGLRDHRGHPVAEVRRATLADHREAHIWGLALLRGAGKGRSEGRLRRKQRRYREADVRRQTKVATRNHRNHIINSQRQASTALGLARVYIERAGSEAMQRNVDAHVASMAETLARRQHPEVFADDTLSPEDHQRAMQAAILEAEGSLHDRLQEVLDAQG
jgi:hypothetical protein